VAFQAAPALQPSGARGAAYRSLLAPAQVTRLLLGIAGAIALALCGALVARLALSREELTSWLETASLGRAADLTYHLALATLAGAAVAGAAFSWWSVRAYRNRFALRQRHPVGAVVHRWSALWAAVPSVLYLAVSVVNGPIAGPETHQIAELLALLAAALVVGAARATHEIVGIVTVAQAHRAELVAADVARDRRAGAAVVAGV
jgi:hypothetical protein